MEFWDKLDSMLEKLHEVPSPKKITKCVTTPIKIIITRTKTFIKCKTLAPQIINKIKSCFTIRDKNIAGYDVITKCYRVDGEYLRIPRFGAFILEKKFTQVTIKSKITRDNPIKLEYNFSDGGFTDIQELITSELLTNWFNDDKFMRGQCGVIINLQAGLGKTFLAMNIMNIFKCRTLVVTHNRNMLRQWVKILKEKFPRSKIACYYGEKKEFGDIIVGVINSLVMPTIVGFETPKEFFKCFDLVIFDEAHEFCAPGRSKIYEIAQAPFMIGLSATPEERTDKLDIITQWNIGPILVAEKLQGYSTDSVPFKGHVSQIKYRGPKKYTQTIVNNALGVISIPKMIEQFTQDTQRTKLIASLILEFYQQNYNIFVFADRRDYLLELNKEMHAQYLQNKPIKSSVVTTDEELNTIRLVSGSKDDDMKQAIEEKQVIFSTYQYMSTGCSIPKMNCIILATPRKSKSRQIINRIFRLGSDYSIVRQIVDIVDWNTPVKNQWYIRKKYYSSQAFTITPKEVKALEVPP